MKKIAFNVPYLTGNETKYIQDAVNSGKISGNGKYTMLCQEYFEMKYQFGKCFLTSSCTDALEMSAILLRIEKDDEVIIPAYTFVSTANAFELRGAKIIFADSMSENPNVDAQKIEELITPNTKAIVVVHYAGIACDMDKIMELAERYKLYVVEDAAQAIDSFYTGMDGRSRGLGSIGHMAAFSFHETKNIISGEGGMLVINDPQFANRAEIIWEKGTNRSAFFRGEIDKYNWVDLGSSFQPSEVTAAFLWSQLEHLEHIQQTRIAHWDNYWNGLENWAGENLIKLPFIPDFATNNAHMFYLACPDSLTRNRLIEHLRAANIHAIFHYQSLHKSPYFLNKHDGRDLQMSDFYSECLFRLPMFFDLKDKEISDINRVILKFNV
jgi:dTDP-4-amino-4,6-dideoxygalactose transaminase